MTFKTDGLSAAGVPTEPCRLTATQASAAIAARRLGCEELVRSCLARIEARETDVRAWLHLRPEVAIRRAREIDKKAPAGKLHGLPWGVKDVIDTRDMPTTHNSPIYQDSRPARDAACIAVVRHFGSLILGKTDTMEFAANGRRAATRNPHNLAHTPGGSSSGSAAAVADFHVPLAFGTQTVGSHIRPASFSGVYGMKPTWALVSREGMKTNAPSLDTIGWYARCIEDLELVADAFNPGAPDCEIPRTARGVRVGLCRSPVWDKIEPAGKTALLGAAKRLAAAGAIVSDLELPAGGEALFQVHQDIYYAEGGRTFLPEALNAPALLAQPLRDQVNNVRGVTTRRLLEAYAFADRYRPVFDSLFGPDLDVVLTPSAPGEAPEGIQNTGSSVFNGNWTILHVPCINIPAGRGPAGLPIGVTLVGPRFGDASLLQFAKLLAPIIDS